MTKLNLIVLLVALTAAVPARGQLLTYPDPNLNSVFPAGGQQGQKVAVELGGLNGLAGATGVIIEGPPGVTVSDVKVVNAATVQATFTIAADAVPGRRWIRVVGGSNGLTNFRYFFVGQLPEVMDKEKNDSPQAAQEVTLPVVINGRINPDLDIDCYRFQAKANQRILAALLAHGMDSLAARQIGFLDASLELLDEQGKAVASADDDLGLDPLLEYTTKTAGTYTLRIQSLGNKGSASAVYRLTLGDVSYPTYVFPGGGKRGQQVEVEFGGPGIAAGTRKKVTLPSTGTYPLYFVRPDGSVAGPDLPILCGDYQEQLEAEANDELKQANLVTVPVTVNGRFHKSGDQDWYRLSLKKGQGVVLDVTAQRHLRSPVDTLLEVYDATGKKLAENDDGILFARPNHCAHDFASADSWLRFTAPQDGDYFLRLSEQSGVGGPHAIYRLSISELKPDFQLYQWPDAVPIWGPATSASFMVEMQHWGGLNSDIKIRVEGLPAGWKGSITNIPSTKLPQTPPPNGYKVILTITAPANAPLGTIASFRVIGTATQDGTMIEREAQYLTLYGNSHNDGMHLRPSPLAQAVVAPALDCRLEALVTEVTGKPGEKIQIPVKLFPQPQAKAKFGLVVNGPPGGASVAWGPPQPVKDGETDVLFPLTLSTEVRPGTYGIVVARSWSSDYRGGRPGPCTPIIWLHVLPEKK